MELISSAQQAQENVQRFQSEIQKPVIRDIIAYVRHWYAVRRPEDGAWIFGPSKFIGYAEMTAGGYGKNFDNLDGRVTEANLKRWFQELKAGHRL